MLVFATKTAFGYVLNYLGPIFLKKLSEVIKRKFREFNYASRTDENGFEVISI